MHFIFGLALTKTTKPLERFGTVNARGRYITKFEFFFFHDLPIQDFREEIIQFFEVN